MSPQQLQQWEAQEQVQLAAVLQAEEEALVELGLTGSAHKTVASMLQGGGGMVCGMVGGGGMVGGMVGDGGSSTLGAVTLGGGGGSAHKTPAAGGHSGTQSLRASWHPGVGGGGVDEGGGQVGEVVGGHRGVLGLSWDPAVAAGVLGDGVLDVRPGGIWDGATKKIDRHCAGSKGVAQSQARPTALMPPVANMWGLR